MNSRVQVLAHRGLVSDTAPENSLKAFADALATGADVIETDVQCSKDGVAIIFHDDDLKRICGLDAKVSEMNWQDLKIVELGSQEKDSFARAGFASVSRCKIQPRYQKQRPQYSPPHQS